jgi:hypothetical protein
MPPPRPEFLRRWLAPAAVLALAPKCLVCGLAYAGLLGLGGAELCGDAPPSWHRVAPVVAGALGVAGFLLHRFARRVTSPVSSR